jgi:hypothetical protein
VTPIRLAVRGEYLVIPRTSFMTERGCTSMVRITRYPHRIRASVVATLVLATVTLAVSGRPADAADTATSDRQDTAPVRGAIHGYVFDGERYRTIDVPGATRTEAWDITNSGDVVGYYTNADGRLHGFRLDKRGRYTKFDDPDGGLENDLTGGNDRGVTVGSPPQVRPDDGRGPRLSARRPRQDHHHRRPGCADQRRLENQQPRPGGRRLQRRGPAGAAAVPARLHLRGRAVDVSNTTLADINDRGQSIGQAFDSADARNSHYTFLRERDGTFTKLPDVSGAVQTIHLGINNRGQTAATAAFLSADGTFVTLRAFRYDDGEPTRIAVPGAVSTFATAINDRGHIVGYYTDPAPGTTGPPAAAAAADTAAGMPMGMDPLRMMAPMLP